MLSGVYLRSSLAREPGASLPAVCRAPLIDVERARQLGQQLDKWAACAVVVLGSSVTLCAGVWLLERWQLR